MHNFLKQYSEAIDLDEEHFNNLFPAGCQRSDFLLFNEICICEFKDLCEFDIKSRIEHVAKKGITTERNLKRDVYSTIEKNLSKANQQIKGTKRTLNKPDAIGLIIIENHIPKDISALSLFDAANRKMENGLDNTDGILCLDFINTVTNKEDSPSHLTQLVLPEKKETEQTKQLYNLVEKLMTDFSIARDSPIYSGFDTQQLEQQWSIDENGQYSSYNGSVNIEINND